MSTTRPCPYCDAPVTPGTPVCKSCEIELPEGFWDAAPPRPMNPADAFSSFGLAPGVDTRSRSLREPHVSLGTTEVSGAVSKDAVVRTFHRHIDDLLACYKTRLTSQPGLAGAFSVSFMILPKGNIGRAEISAVTLSDAPLEQCVLASLTRWSFPRPSNGGVVWVKTVLNLQEE